MCVKIIRSVYNGSVYKEAEILSRLCHPNISYLFGICIESRYKMIILSYHGMKNCMSHSLHSALLSSSSSKPAISLRQWKVIVTGFTFTTYMRSYIMILKEDNVVLQQQENE